MKKITGWLSLGFLIFACGPDNNLFDEKFINPSKVDLIFPEANSECTSGENISESQSQIVFNWTNAEIGDFYRLNLTNLTTGENSIYETDSSSQKITLFRGTPYRWRVDTGFANSDQITSSEVQVFYNSGPGAQNYIPFPALPIFPSNGAVLNQEITLVDLFWETIDLDNDIVSYDIFFGIDPAPPLYRSDLESNFMENLSVKAGTVYYWKVLSYDSQGNISNSQVFTFEVSN